jgi:hypothetical protein
MGNCTEKQSDVTTKDSSTLPSRPPLKKEENKDVSFSGREEKVDVFAVGKRADMQRDVSTNDVLILTSSPSLTKEEKREEFTDRAPFPRLTFRRIQQINKQTQWKMEELFREEKYLEVVEVLKVRVDN